MSLIEDLKADARRLRPGRTNAPSLVKLFVTNSSYGSAVIFRVSSALRKSSPASARLVSKINLILHGIDIDYRARIGPGILFAHPVGVVIGGGCTIGAGVTFMSSVVLGRRDVLDGPDIGMYPTIEDNVTFGTGSTVLGPVNIGNHSRIGAHALVLESISPNSLAVGVPARAKPPKPDS